jgi:Tfp pilus assembly protein PilE
MSASGSHAKRRNVLAGARRRQRGAVLMEYMIVLALLGVLAALALDARTNPIKRAYLDRARELMRPVP